MSKKKKHRVSPEVRPISGYFPAAAFVPFAGILVLYLIGALHPGRLTWGFNYWSLMTAPAVYVAFLVAVVVSVPAVADKIAAGLTPAVRFLSRLLGRIGRPLSVVLISAVVTAALFYWRSKAFVYGDGYTILNDVSSGEDIVLFDQYYFQILTVYFNHYAYGFLSSVTQLSPAEIMSAINAVGGTVALWAVYRISVLLTADRNGRALLVIGALSSGSVVLFFGYVENYTWSFSLGLWALSFCIGYVRRRHGAALMLIFALVASLMHLIVLPMVLVALLALLIRRGSRAGLVSGIPLRYLNGGLAVLSLGFVGLTRLFDIDIFVPLMAGPDSLYSVLSGDHLLDVANEVLLVAPLGVALLIFLLLYGRGKAAVQSREDAVLAITALVFFLGAFWIDPELGAPRDWDLLSFFGFPLTLWAMLRFARLFPAGKVSRSWVVAAGVIAAAAIGPNVYEKSHLEAAVPRLDAQLAADPHYQATYRQADRCVPWSLVLQEQLGEWRLSLKYLHQRLQAAPDDFKAYYNLGSNYYYLGVMDTAYVFLRRAADMKADEVKLLLKLSDIAQRMGDCHESVAWAGKAHQLEPVNAAVMTRLGVAQIQCQQVAEALMSFRRAGQIEPGNYDHIAKMGVCHAMMGSTDSALFCFASALPMAPMDKRPDIYGCLISVELELGRLEDARQHLNTLRQINPQWPDLPALTARLTEALNR